MSMTILPSSTWAPSVIQLLPFSANDVKTKTDVKATPEPINSFPALAVTRSQSESPRRTKSAIAYEHSSFTSKELFKQNISVKKSNEKDGKEEVSSLNLEKHDEDKVKVSVNDLNGQILQKKSIQSPDPMKDHVNLLNSFRQSFVKSNTSILRHSVGDLSSQRQKLSLDNSNEAADDSQNIEFKTRVFLKPVLRQRKSQRNSSATRFCRSSTNTYPKDQEIKKSEAKAEMKTPVSKGERESGSLVKVHVRDIPRSKTPISENDPDKLNMKHVIAFLEANEKEKIEETNSDSVEPTKNLPTDNEVENKLRESRKTNNEKMKHNSTLTNDVLNQNKTIANIFERHTFQAKLRPSSFHGADSNNVHKYVDGSIVLETPSTNFKNRSVDFSKRPLSLHALRDGKEIPSLFNSEKLKRTQPEQKQFRLHRFLTIVPQKTEPVVENKNSKAAGKEIICAPGLVTRSVTALERKPQLKLQHEALDSKYFYLYGNSKSARSRRLNNNKVSTNSNKQEKDSFREKQNGAIHLPKPQFDDSDEEPQITLPKINVNSDIGNRPQDANKSSSISTENCVLADKKLKNTSQASSNQSKTTETEKGENNFKNSENAEKLCNENTTEKYSSENCLIQKKDNQQTDISIPKVNCKYYKDDNITETDPLKTDLTNASKKNNLHKPQPGDYSEIQITQPKQTKAETIKLSLRKERHLTRETTYMLDIAKTTFD